MQEGRIVIFNIYSYICYELKLNEMKLTKTELIKRQNWTLNQKIDHSLGAIEQFYNHFNGKTYVSFSGGKDSSVLLHLARIIYWDIPAVFVDTGLEYPEIRDFIKEIHPETTWIKPKKNI